MGFTDRPDLRGRREEFARKATAFRYLEVWELELILVSLFDNREMIEVCLCRLDCSLPSSFDGGEGRLSRDDDGVAVDG